MPNWRENPSFFLRNATMKHILKQFLLVLLIAASVLPTAHAGDYYNGIWVDAIIDVRTPVEYAEGHIIGAINIPIGAIGMGIQSVKGVNQDSSLLVYCRSGIRSARARDILMLQGYKKVMDGGAFSKLAETLPSCVRPYCTPPN